MCSSDLAGVPALDLMPKGARRDRVLLYFHGGAYVLLSARTHAKLAAGIGAAAGCRVVSLDYRLAPEHPHPTALLDAEAAIDWLVASASSLDVDAVSRRGGNVGAAKEIGKTLAERAKKAGVSSVVFDRNGFRYHGRVKAVAEGAREGGLQF